MEKQPFLIVKLADGSKKIINERHVVSVEEDEKGAAYIRMSNGDELTVTEPIYEDWENDFLSRKF